MTSSAPTVPRTHALREDDGVHHPEVPPRPAVAADDEERQHLRGQDDGQRPQEERVAGGEQRALEAQAVRRVVRERNQAEVEQHLGDAPLVHEVGDERRRRPAEHGRIGVLVHADARQVDREDDHRDQERQRDDERPALVVALQQERDARRRPRRASRASRPRAARTGRRRRGGATSDRGRPGTAGGPDIRRAAVTSVVSKIGISSRSTGAATTDSTPRLAVRFGPDEQRQRGEVEAEEQAARRRP